MYTRPSAAGALRAAATSIEAVMIKSTRHWMRHLGPGLITGAADDDPSGIATYSQAGAQFGYQLGWTVVLTYPLMVGIQMVSARMGRVTGHGLASNIRSHFPRPVLYAIVAMLVVANTINIAADIAAMGEALAARRRRLASIVYVDRVRRRLRCCCRCSCPISATSAISSG